MPRKPDPDRLAAMRTREAVPAPDFAGAEALPAADGTAPYLKQPCPVTPLGKSGKTIYFLDRSNQIIDASTRCEKGDLMLWFGNGWLVDNYPQTKSDKKGNLVPVPGEFDQRDIQVALVEDCFQRGIFNPQGKVFGRGAHRFPGDSAMLALHMGDRVLLANWRDAEGKRRRDPDIRRAGRLRNHDGRDAYFPALERLPAPAIEAASTRDSDDLLQYLGEWYWNDRVASPLLLLGFICQMYVCGALAWRSHLWLAGPTAAGKTTLQRLIRALHEDWCLFTEDASEAALRQTLGEDTLPVMIDEAEAHDKPEKLAAILNLMKKASSGAKMHRGSQDHKAQTFTAQSCFLLSSVLVAAMRGEDRNRIVILEMLQVPADAERLEFDEEHWKALGRRLRRRMVDQWPRFDRTLSDYESAIARMGFSGRWRDTYGTLLAFADLALFDQPTTVNTPGGPQVENAEPGPVRVARLASIVRPVIALGKSESRSDVDRVLIYLMTTSLPGAHGRPPEPVALWVERAMTLVEEHGQFPTEPSTLRANDEARAKLKAHGLRVVNVEERPGQSPSFTDATPERWDDAWLAVAYQTNKATCELFKNSDWQEGAWLQSLVKVPGARKSGGKLRFSSSMNPDYAVLVPLQAFREE